MTTKTDLVQHLRLWLKAAWMLVLSYIEYINNNNNIIYIVYIRTPLRYPVYLSTLLRLLRLIEWEKYHNAVATEVAGRKVANV